MRFEDMVIAHQLIDHLGDAAVQYVLDLLEDHQYSPPPTVLTKLRAHVHELDAEFGGQHPAVIQMQKLLNRAVELSEAESTYGSASRPR